MSTESTEGESDLRQRIEHFLQRNFPQIQMHGGSTAIQKLDEEAGEVTIALGGACSGCGISSMTTQAIKTRMKKEIPEINEVHALTGMVPPTESGNSRGGSIDSDDDSEAPF